MATPRWKEPDEWNWKAPPSRRNGAAPHNRGRRLPPEVLTGDEVLRLIGGVRPGHAGGRPQPGADRGHVPRRVACQ